MRVSYSARSHMGKIRKNNEDNLHVDGVVLTQDIRERPFRIDGVSNQPGIFAVCDGLGGEEEGERASLLTALKLADVQSGILESSPKKYVEIIQEFADDVSESLQSVPEESRKRAGTTLALAVVTNKGIYPFNIGDSRIYYHKYANLMQVTYDHTLLQDRIRSGEIDANNSKGMKGKNKLTRCIGIGNHANVESYPTIKGSCRILICSDGLSDMVSNSEIRKILSFSGNSETAADYLLGVALENGGRDNITIIVLDVEVTRMPHFKWLTKAYKGFIETWKAIRKILTLPNNSFRTKGY